ELPADLQRSSDVDIGGDRKMKRGMLRLRLNFVRTRRFHIPDMNPSAWAAATHTAKIEAALMRHSARVRCCDNACRGRRGRDGGRDRRRVILRVARSRLICGGARGCRGGL